jgi:hypothetical protein
MVNAVRLTLTAAAVAVFVAPAGAGVVGIDKVNSPSASAAMPALYRSCTNFNRKYPHGVGRVGARDKVRPGNEPVTNFKRSNRIFAIAMSWNKGLDRDKDRVACEKH